MKNPNSQYHRAIQPLVEIVDRGVVNRQQIAEELQKMGHKRASRQMVFRWLRPNPRERVEPLYSVGVDLIGLIPRAQKVERMQFNNRH
jgi:hypothetical protein